MSQVTKRALEQSLKKLLLQKPLNKITINDITEDCGINRMTFYYHFKDIYDLVEWSCREEARRSLEKSQKNDNWRQTLMGIFESVRENKDLIMNIYNCVHQEKLEYFLKPQVDALVMDLIDRRSENLTVPKEDKEFVAKVYSYIMVGVVVDWIKNDMSADPEQIVHKLGILLGGTLNVALEKFII